MTVEKNTSLGRDSTVIPGRFGEPLQVTHAEYSRGGGNATPTRPLFLCMHGWGSNENDLADLMRYVAPHNDYVSLRAPLTLPSAGPDAYSWFHDSVPQGTDCDVDIFAAASAVDAWVEKNIPPDRDIVPIGFSQGGALAIHLLRLNPERYRASVCLSGFIAPAELPHTAPADGRLASLEIPVFYGYGAQDNVIAKFEQFAAAAWLEEHTWLTSKSYRALDHSVSLEELADLRQWLLTQNISSGLL